MTSTYIIPNVKSLAEVTSYASGIETMRQAMSLSVDTSILEAYASGTNVLARNIETYASGVETLRQAMVTGGDTALVTAYASGTRTLQITIQDNATTLNTYTSGVQEQLADFQIAQTSVNTEFNSYASGIETLRRAMVTGGDTALVTSYASGIGELTQIIQTDVTNLTVYASGIETLRRAMTGSSYDDSGITAYASGIETLRRAMVSGGDVTAVTTYASGINTQVIAIQDAQTIINSTLNTYTSGVQEQLSDFQIAQTVVNTGIEIYASGIETLRRAMVDDDSVLTTYASGINTQVIAIQNAQTTTNNNSNTYASGVQEQLSDFQIEQTTTNSNINTYTSGVQEQLSDFQIAQTAVNNVVDSNLSGIETLIILNQSNIGLVTSYASGTKTLLNIIQNNLTSNDSTTSGINTTVIGLSRYASGTHNANTILIPNGVGSPSYDDMQDFLQMTRSSGRLTSGVITTHSGNPVGAVDISVMEGMIFTEDRLGADYIFFKQAAATNGLVVADNSVSWVYYDWNSGSPRYQSTVTHENIHEYNQFVVGRVFRAGNDVEVRSTGINIYDEHRRAHNRLIAKYGGMDHVSGGIVSQHTTPLRIQSNIGEWYTANQAFTTPASDTFQVWYKTGGGAWAESGDLTLFSDVFDGGTSKVYETYQNGTSLDTLGANRYGIYWIFLCPEGDLYVVLGTASYANIGAAQASTVPASLPPYCVDWARLVGRVICQKSSATLFSVESSFSTSFTLSAATDHSSLANLTAADSHPITAITGLDGYLSGTKVLNILNQTNVTNLTTYASGIETLRRAMTTSSAAGDKVEITITQNGHGFTSGVWLYRATDSSYKKAKADAETTADVVGVISDVPTINSFKLVTAGSVAGIFTGLTDGNRYFLSAASDGGMTNSDPANSSDSWVSKPILHAVSATGGIVHIERGSVAVSGNTTVDLPLNYLTGFETAPYTTSGISIGTGSCRSKEVLNDQYNIVSNSTFVKKLTGPFVAGTLQNGIDSGNRAASTTYHVHEITNGTDVDTLFSTSPTSPTLPSGFVASRRIASFKTDNTGYFLPYSQNGDRFDLLTRVIEANGATPGAAGATLTLAGVPSGIICFAIMRASTTSTTVGDEYEIKALTTVAGTAMILVCQVASKKTGGIEVPIKTNTSAQVFHTSTDADFTVTLVTQGWIDTRGRD